MGKKMNQWQRNPVVSQAHHQVGYNFFNKRDLVPVVSIICNMGSQSLHSKGPRLIFIQG